MPKVRKLVILTSIERLDAQLREAGKPGFLLFVCLSFDHGKTGAELRPLGIEKFGVDVPERTYMSYRVKRYLPAKARIAGLMEMTDAIMAATAKYKRGELARSFVFERLSQAFDAGETVTLKDLLRESRQLDGQQLEEKRIHVDEKKVDNVTRSLALAEKKNEQYQLREKQVAAIVTEAEQKSAEGKPLDDKTIFRRISAVIGTGAPLEERVEQVEAAS